MGTVLWGNMLINGILQCDEQDKYALFKNTKKLDRICENLGLLAFSELQDFTDMKFNIEEIELPEGMDSTDDLIAAEGNWVEAESAQDHLQKLLSHIVDNKIRFGLISDAHDKIVEELRQTLNFIGGAKQEGAKFNFSVVM